MTALNDYCIVGFDNFENFVVASMYVYICQKIWRRCMGWVTRVPDDSLLCWEVLVDGVTLVKEE